MGLDTWFHVSFDQDVIDIHIHPLGGDESHARVAWDEIIRICFKPANFLDSDEILIFTKTQEKSYLIPLDADGASALWNEILARDLFDAELAIELASSTDGRFHCWPQE